MNIAEAARHMANGGSVRMGKWEKGKSMEIGDYGQPALVYRDNSKMVYRYRYTMTIDDLLCEDWEVYENGALHLSE